MHYMGDDDYRFDDGYEPASKTTPAQTNVRAINSNATGGNTAVTTTPHATLPGFVDAIILEDGKTIEIEKPDATMKTVGKALGEHGKKLAMILSFHRPTRGINQQGLLDAVIGQINTTIVNGVKLEAKADTYGNVLCTILPKDKTTVTTAFTAHCDTVHFKDARQEIAFDVEKRLMFKVDNAPLGADDGTGVYILLQMIAAHVPGVYLFFKDEERGALGSEDFLKHQKAWLKTQGVTKIVSFDRKGTEDVITSQRGTICASQAFAIALSDALNVHGLNYKPCANGVFTDSATFMYDFAECTNLSVGYDAQHTAKETQDLAHLDKLIEAVTKIDWEALPTVRTPATRPTYSSPSYNNSYNSKSYTPKLTWKELSDWEKKLRPDNDTAELFKLIEDAPWLVALFLTGENYTAKEIKNAMLDYFSKS